jgi:hypothetical protein
VRAVDKKGIKRNVLHRAIRIALGVIALPLLICAVLSLYIPYSAYTSDGWGGKERMIFGTFFGALGLTAIVIAIQCILIAITGLIPRWVSESAANEYEKLNKNPWVFLMFSVLFSFCSLLFLGVIYYLTTR